MSAPKKQGRFLFRVIRRLLLVVFTVVLMGAVGLWILLNQVLRGPSPAARDALTISLADSPSTGWIPGLFLEDEEIAGILESAQSALPAEVTDLTLITPGTDAGDWSDAPDGIRVELYRSNAFTAHIMTVRDPGQVWLSYAAGGARIAEQLKAENAAAAIYAAADTEQLLISGGVAAARVEADAGFAGFTEKGILYLSGSMTPDEAFALPIRDGCACGMILILNGQINEGAYNASSGYSPRACIGQRADGSVVFLTIDGLSADSVGGTYRDCIDILYEYGCVNACCLDGVPAAMLCGDRMIHTDSLPRAESAIAPGFWMIRPAEEG